MQPLSDADWIQLVRHFAGETTPPERGEIERRMADFPQWGDQVEQLRQSWLASDPDPVTYDGEALWTALQGKIHADDAANSDDGRLPPRNPTKDLPHPAERHSSRRYTPLNAAVLGALALIVGGTMLYRHTHRADSIADSVYTTGKGERANITLPDGSTVVLDVASRLSVPSDFGTGDHVVHLTGEALFTVSHHDATPFTVVTTNAATRVLGTTFSVRQYPEDITTTVAVSEGKIQVGSAIVSARQSIAVDRGSIGHLHASDPSQFSFATGVLTVNPMPLRQAIPELNRWYDADIRLGDPAIGTQEIRGNLAAGSLAELTEILRLTLNVRVERTGRVLTLYPVTH